MTEPIGFTLPKKPRVKQQEAPPDARKVAVIPIRACTDPNLTLGMVRVLLCICSYANRAGITWVGQTKLATELKISQQAVSRQIVKLTKLGYIEMVKKAKPGERMSTWRVIFDPSISAEDAVSITSSIEDTRPPHMKQEQEDQTVDPEGLKRIAQIVRSAVRPVKAKKEYTMPKDGQTITTKRMHAEIEQAKKRRSKASQSQHPEVVSESQHPTINQHPVIQPKAPFPTTSEGCTEHKNKGYIEDIKVDSIKEVKYVLHNQGRAELRQSGLTDEQIDTNLAHLLDAYQAEGLTPNPDRLVTEILQLSRDA